MWEKNFSHEREPEAVAIVKAQRLIEGCCWVRKVLVCDFLVGHPGEDCKRCGASWMEHYPRPAD